MGHPATFGMAEERRRGNEEAGSSTRRPLRLRSGSGFGRNDNAEKADSSCLASLARRNDKKILRSDADDKVELELSPKELGEIAEAEFLRTVLRKKIAVSKPWGEN
jgi:hypothetical protein